MLILLIFDFVSSNIHYKLWLMDKKTHQDCLHLVKIVWSIGDVVVRTAVALPLDPSRRRGVFGKQVTNLISYTVLMSWYIIKGKSKFPW